MWCPSLEDKEGDTHSLFAQILMILVWWFRWCPVYKPTLVITKWEDTKSFGITRSHGAEVHFGFLESCQISMVSLTGFNSVILRVIRSPKNWNCLGYLDDPHFVGKYEQVTFCGLRPTIQWRHGHGDWLMLLWARIRRGRRSNVFQKMQHEIARPKNILMRKYSKRIVYDYDLNIRNDIWWLQFPLKKRDDPILATNQNYHPLNFFSIIKGVDLFIKTIILQDFFFL